MGIDGSLAACAEVGKMEPLFRAAGFLLPVHAVGRGCSRGLPLSDEVRPKDIVEGGQCHDVGLAFWGAC